MFAYGHELTQKYSAHPGVFEELVSKWCFFLESVDPLEHMVKLAEMSQEI